MSCCSDDVDDRILLKGHRLTDLVVDFDPDVVRVELRERGSAVEIAVGAATPVEWHIGGSGTWIVFTLGPF